ncbi:MAG: extracellular solute-binding protein [Lachnospiraceae bacterium]|uniref:extracellular solute-binding protein n=1 Tax=Clostridium sp. WB02_MRS01 TaxID=2605777 RepID=UPI0018A6AD82|nr:extracellular solute-binding protein [Clostridium sp. WB02_MRS01]MBW4845715.1 extracellular solute-binding protein [Lachnospiraceae bacterium]
MKKRWVLPVMAAVFISLLTGCEKKDPYGLSEKDPVTITIWHYYNGVQKEEFDRLVQEFNENEGREKGIIVKAFNKGSIDELSNLINESIEKKIGSDPLPDVFSAYVDKVYEVDQMGLAADLSSYLTSDEIGEYVDAYMEEGKFDSTGAIKVFPIAKSTEILTVNKTDWDKFAEATGETEEALSTWEGITRVAESYYKWTDSLTEEPDDGKAFFGRDAFANYMIIGSLQLGHEIFKVKDGKTVLDFDEQTMRKLWDNYYVPYVNGYFGSYGKFRSDDVKTGQLVAFVGATSGIAYFPTSVTLEDGTNYAIESKLYPLPNFYGTVPCAVQQGAGMMVFKSEEKREYAATLFLKWFTCVGQNMKFAIGSGYLPVKKAAGNEELLKPFLTEAGEDSGASQNLLIGLNTANQYRLYTSKPFEGGDRARNVLNSAMVLKAKEDYEKICSLMEQGVKRESAVAEFVTEENFDQWYRDTMEQLEAIIGE